MRVTAPRKRVVLVVYGKADDVQDEMNECLSDSNARPVQVSIAEDAEDGCVFLAVVAELM
jgi:hypothetical protein